MSKNKDLYRLHPETHSADSELIWSLVQLVAATTGRLSALTHTSERAHARAVKKTLHS